MQLKHLLRHVVRPALTILSELADKPMGGPEVECLMLAIALQESDAAARAQHGGPARSYWQFERRGGFYGVRNHARTKDLAAALAKALDLAGDEEMLWLAFPDNDLLAAGFARLLIYSDNAKIPALGAQDEAWQYYLRNWRPGKPGPGRWPKCYTAALQLVSAREAPSAEPSEAFQEELRKQLEVAYSHVLAAKKVLEELPL